MEAGISPVAICHAAQQGQEQTKFCSSGLLGGFELLHARYLRHTFARHWHEEHTFGVIDRGVEKFEYRGATYLAPAGSIVMFNAGETHTGETLDPGGWGFRLFYVPVKTLQQLADESGMLSSGPLYFPHVLSTDSGMAHQLLSLHRALSLPTDCKNKLDTESFAIRVFSRLLRLYADTRRASNRAEQATPQCLANARQFLELHFKEEVSLSELAAICGVSRFHFLRQFHQYYGLPPHALQVQLRVLHVQKLLRSGMPAVRAAQMAGFTDQSHLNRHFKKLVGVTPGQFAR